MQSFAKGLSHKRIRRQSGSVATLGALWLMVAVICLATIDIGNVFWQKRELQKIADLAALAGASGSLHDGACLVNAESNVVANNGKKEELTYVRAGRWLPVDGINSYEYFTENQKPFNACRVKITRQVPYFFVFSAGNGSSRVVEAQATAKQATRLAKLGIRTTVLDINSDKSPLLNPLFTYLLGGKLNISGVGWNGLLNTDINLLSFLRELAKIDTNVKLGNVDQLLDTTVGVGDVLNAMINAVDKTSTADIAIGAIKDILNLGAKVGGLKIKLSQLLNLQTGAGTSALNTDVNLFELVQAAIQIGNGNNAVAAKIDVPLGLVNGAVQAKVIEKPIFTAIGDPDLAIKDHLGANKIYVRTAQIRLLISLDAPVLDGILTVLSGTLDLLFKLLWIDFNLLPPTFRVDVGVEVGGGEAYLKNYTCTPSKKISINAKSSLAKVVAGKFGGDIKAATENFFSTSAQLMDMKNLNILDIYGFYPDLKHYLGGLDVGLKLDPVKKEFEDYSIDAVSLEKPPVWNQLRKNLSIVGDLKNTLKGIDINFKRPSPGAPIPPGVPDALNMVVDKLLQGLGGTLGFLLAPIIDPLINGVLWLVGADLAKMEVAGQLNCDYRADLVY